MLRFDVPPTRVAILPTVDGGAAWTRIERFTDGGTEMFCSIPARRQKLRIAATFVDGGSCSALGDINPDDDGATYMFTRVAVVDGGQCLLRDSSP